MDKEWTKLPRHWKRYRKGVKSFLDFAYTKGSPQGREISCPCAHCANGKWARRHVVRNHLIAAGFVEGYDVWVNHGEDMPLPMDVDKDTKDQEDSHDDIGGLLYDIFRDVVEEDESSKGPNEEAKKFYNLINEAKQELYPGCEGFSTLSFIIRLYLLKCLHGWSNASFTSLLELLKEAIPNLNIPESFNKTKAMISDLGLDYKKIHACPNDCMLHWKDRENDSSCSICKASRWKEFTQVQSESSEQEKYDHKVPAKVLRKIYILQCLIYFICYA
jgi:hypothetical protein